MVIFKKCDGFWKHPRLAKIQVPLYFEHQKISRISLLHWVSGTMEVDELLRLPALQIPPAILKNEHDIF